MSNQEPELSINSIKEFMIHINSFRNIDLLNQGLYHIRLRIFYQKDNKNHFALPYYSTHSKEIEITRNLETNSQTSQNQIKSHSISPSEISSDGKDYITKTFFIRYSDEEVDIDEFCLFRIEKNEDFLKIFIEFELFFNENMRKEGKNNEKNDFRSVYTCCIGINDHKDLIKESYIPVIFQDSYSSILNINLISTITDFRLRIYDNEQTGFIINEEVQKKQVGNENGKSENEKQKLKITIKPDSRQGTINQMKKKDFSKDEKEKINKIHFLLLIFMKSLNMTRIEEGYNKENNSLTDVFIDSIYEKYVISLVSIYISLQSNYMRLINTCLSQIKENQEIQQNEIDYLSSTNQLLLYNDDTESVIIDSTSTAYNSNNNLIKDIKLLSKRLSQFNPDYVLSRIMAEIGFISAQVQQIWQKYIEMLRYIPGEYSYIMNKSFYKSYITEISKFNIKSIVTITDNNSLIIPIESNQLKLNLQSSFEYRTELNKICFEQLFEVPSLNISNDVYPILFEEMYIKRKEKLEDCPRNKYDSNLVDDEKDYFKNDSSCKIFLDDNTDIALQSGVNALHLVVLVHGFQGNSFDLRLIKYNLSLINSTLVFLSSSSNQDDTESDFFIMGKRLADEVKSFLKEWNDGVMFSKISFIGHSIGGLIIRAALPNLKEYSKKMFFYCSLSSPHLGYIYSNSTLVDAGIWLLKKIKKCTSLEQLSFSDSKSLDETCLYRLSNLEGFEWFDHVFLISSHQDYYAPYESTRIQVGDKNQGNDNKNIVYRTMASNLLNRIKSNALKRIDVNFVISESNIDSFIGRTAHIQFLENQNFMRILFYGHVDLFS